MNMSGSTGNTVPDPLPVAVGIARDGQGRVLIALRPPGKVRAGQWEFPGGKIHTGEAPRDALRREWREELGVEIECGADSYVFVHRYADQAVELHVFDHIRIVGCPHPIEGQILDWSPVAELEVARFVAGDRHILARLQLPRRYLVSNATGLGWQSWLDRLDRILAQGSALVQLREHGLSEGDYARLADETEVVCRGRGAMLLFNRDPAWVARRPWGGLHLTSVALKSLQKRPLPPGRWIAASCHDEDEVQCAEALSIDFVTLSPVCVTASHPARPPLGWAAFRRVSTRRGLPIFAQGGLDDEDLHWAVGHGAHGIAILRAAWRTGTEFGSRQRCP